MTYYCEKCGHKIDENQKVCSFCGAVQKRLTSDDYETKSCKKCGKKIYVNANFCPYCGTDQAILDLNKDLSVKNDDEETDHNNAENLTAQQKEAQKQFLNDQEQLGEFLKQLTDAGIKYKVEKTKDRNENAHPGLIVSTKLIFKDMFKINKRLGINDFWWGVAGLTLIMIAISIATGEIIAISGLHLTMKHLTAIAMVIAVAYNFILTTAIWRRIHDINLPNWIMLLILIPFGSIMLCLICLLGPNLDNNPYTFDVKDYNNRNR